MKGLVRKAYFELTNLHPLDVLILWGLLLVVTVLMFVCLAMFLNTREILRDELSGEESYGTTYYRRKYIEMMEEHNKHMEAYHDNSNSERGEGDLAKFQLPSKPVIYTHPSEPLYGR